MSEPQALSISERRGTVRFLHRGNTIFEGAERDGRLVASFKKNCGVRAGFSLEGARTSDGFDLSGSGTVYIGGLALCDATVNASPSGVVVDVPAGWADRIKPLRLMLGAVPGSWCGVMELNEPLKCMVIGPQTLRASLAFEMSRSGAPLRCLATAELDGLKVEIALTEKLRGGLAEGLPEIRRSVLDAVSEKLTEELDLSERRFCLNPDGLLFEDYEQEVGEYSVQPMAEPNAAGARKGYLLQPEVRSSARSRGYVSANAPERSAVGRGASLPRGYVPRPEIEKVALPKGYVPRPEVEKVALPRGYVPKPQPVKVAKSREFVSADAAQFSGDRERAPLQKGYVPRDRFDLAVPSRGYLQTRGVGGRHKVGRHIYLSDSVFDSQAARRPHSDHVSHDGNSDSHPNGEERSLLFNQSGTPATFETIAYRILWCKDLLQAVAKAMAQDR